MVLKNEPKLINKFYMGVIGKLVLAVDLAEARKILKAALYVSSSESEGDLENAHENLCNVNKRYSLHMIAGQSKIDDITQETKLELDEKDDVNSERFTVDSKATLDSPWGAWATTLNE